MSEDTRPDGHSWFKRHDDAYVAALFRADLTGCRYSVTYDKANRWWNITELTKRHQGPIPVERKLDQ